MISTRGPENVVVLDRSRVPVDEVCEAVAEHKPLNWIKTRYPVTDDEIFQCLETFIDITAPVNGDMLELRLRDPSTPSRLFDMETVLISDRVYFAILTYARVLAPECNDIHMLYRIGIESILVECLMDIKKDEVALDEADGLYRVVFEAFKKVYTGLENDVDRLLEQFTHEHKAHLEAVRNAKN